MRAVEVVTLLASLTVNVVVLSSHPLLVVLTGALLLAHPECGLRGYVEIARTTWGFRRGFKNRTLIVAKLITAVAIVLLFWITALIWAWIGECG